MDVNTMLSIFLGILAVVATVSAALAVLLSTKAKVTIEALRGDRDDDARRITKLENDLLAMATENATLRSENETLRSMKDSTAAVQRLADVLALADQGRQQEHHDIAAAIQSVNIVVNTAHDEVMAVIGRTSHTHGGAV